MAKNNIEINIKAKADKSEVEDLSDAITTLKEANNNVEVDVNTDDSEIESVKKEVDELDGDFVEVDFEIDDKGNLKSTQLTLDNIDGETVTVDVSADDNEIKKVQKEIKNTSKSIDIPVKTDDSEIKSIKQQINDLKAEKVDVDVIVDDSGVKSAKMLITDINGEHIEVDLNVDDSSLKSIQKEIDSLKGENIEVSLHVDDSEIKNAQKELDDLSSRAVDGLGSTQNAVTGLVSGMAGNSIWDTIYGTSKRAETNKILLKNMADTGTSYETLYNTIDTTTDKSLISMQSLIPGLNGIKSATGATASEINNITPGVASFGQYVLALTGSEAKAETAMFDLSKGIKGLYASLDQYGITEDSLMRTGLWSGKEDDLEGYIAAVNEVTGSTDELMGSAQGLEALMGKAFSRGGKKIGTEILPHVKTLLQGFIDLDSATGGWLSTAMLIGGGAITGLVMFLSVAGQALNGITMMREAMTALREAEMLQTIASKASAAAQWLLNLAMDANPITIVVIAIIALIAVLGYLYFNNEQVRNAINGLGQTFVEIGQIIYNAVLGFVNSAITFLQSLWDYIITLGGLLPTNVSMTGNQIIDTVLRVLIFLATLPIQIGIIFMNIIAKTLGFGNNFVQKLIQSASKSVTGFMNNIASLPSKLQGELNSMLSAVGQWASTLPAKFWEAGVNAVKNFLDALGIHSPGIMQTKLLAEMEDTGDRLPNASRNIIRNVELVGEDIVSSFGNPMLNIGFNVDKNTDIDKNILSSLENPKLNVDIDLNEITGFNKDNMNILNNNLVDILLSKDENSTGNIINLTLNVGSVDKKERVDEIIDVIRNYFMWNNTTAGRTV